MTSTTDTIPLNRLTAWSGNVRKTGADTGLAELSASIAAHGLLQSLVVRKDKKGKYAVVAGRRRLLALASLAEAGTIASDAPVPCHVIAGDANATEISLAENAVREQMHPADEFDAFLALIETGMRPADIAARFGVTETVVQQRLKLARVSPVIIAAYRNDEIALAHVMAFAVTDDHAAQERVWDELGEWQLQDPGQYPRCSHRGRGHGQEPACEIRHAQSLRKGRRRCPPRPVRGGRGRRFHSGHRPAGKPCRQEAGENRRRRPQGRLEMGRNPALVRLFRMVEMRTPLSRRPRLSPPPNRPNSTP